MAKLFVTIVLAVITLQTTHAQEAGSKPQRSVYLEAFGASNLVGINYDSRFKAGSHWGYRTGIGYTYSKSEFILDGSNTLTGFSVPLEVNYLTGRKRSHLELGFGVNLGYYTQKYGVWNIHWYKGDDSMIHMEPDYMGEAKERLWGYYFYGNVGYRYQSSRGFQFRVGINPTFNLGGEHGMSKYVFPYISFGYSF